MGRGRAEQDPSGYAVEPRPRPPGYAGPVLPWVTVVVLVATAAFGLMAAFYALRRRPIDDPMIVVLGVLELALLVQVVVGIVQGISTSRDYEKPVFFAYLVTVPFIAPVASFLALKERTRSSMAVVLGSAVVVAVLVGRLNQIWSLHA